MECVYKGNLSPSWKEVIFVLSLSLPDLKQEKIALLELPLNIAYIIFGWILSILSFYLRGCPCDVMVKAMDFGIAISEFKLHSSYYVHFRANTLGNGMNPLILLAMG